MLKALLICVIFVSCLKQDGYKFLSSSGQNPSPGGDPRPISGTCLHKEAMNFSPTADPQGENCVFETCTDPLKTGYSIDKIIEYQNYIKPRSGFIINKDSLCGSSNSDGNSSTEFPSGYTNYHTYQEFTEKIRSYQKQYPQTSELITIGKSVQERPLLGIKISHSENIKNPSEGLPAMVIFGTHHAREHLSTEVPLLMIKFLLDRLESNNNFQELMKSREIYLFPLINPDGAIYDIRGSSFDLWRKNVRQLQGTSSIGVDLNRNYSVGFGGSGASPNPSAETYHGPSPFSEPETQAIKKFVEENSSKIKTMITFHSFSELILYPWGGSIDQVPSPDFQVFEKMANDMAAMNGYTPMQASDLYVASGDTCDWAYKEHKVFCVTFELTPANARNSYQGFYPSQSVIQQVFTANQNPVLYMLEATDNPYKVTQP